MNTVNITSSGTLHPKRCRRTFTGCWRCRARKVKCDELTPSCTPCQKLGALCLGYGSKLVWVTSDQKSYEPHGRRYLRCDLTWAHIPTLHSDQVDHFVSLCDSAEHVRDSSVQWALELNIPFGVFTGQPSPHHLPHGTPLKDEEAFLFRHYVDHVALIMLPYEDQRNPWKTSYPAEALYSQSQEQRALYHAMIAQAALNLAHLGCSRDNLMLQAARYYALAINELRSCIETSLGTYSSLIAAISTLMFVEIYSGHSSTWRTHFNGAWAFLRIQEASEPWNVSEFAWVSTQSLCLINIVNETSIKHQQGVPQSKHPMRIVHENPPSFISSASSFGFTIGATQLLMKCITDINKLASVIEEGRDIQAIDNDVSSLYIRLEACREDQTNSVTTATGLSLSTSKEEKAAWYHLNAFIAATYIYLYRTVFDLPPSSDIIRKNVAEVFENVGQFMKNSSGNFSLWPTFIAAVEADEAHHIAAAREWLKFATSVGMGNRFKAKAIIEEVWRLRQEISTTKGSRCGDISVDWRDVMIDLEMDILLV